MIVKVISNKSDTWYSDCINQYFHTFQFAQNPIIFFTPTMFFYPEDVEIVKAGIVPDAFVPSLVQFGRS